MRAGGPAAADDLHHLQTRAVGLRPPVQECGHALVEMLVGGIDRFGDPVSRLATSDRPPCDRSSRTSVPDGRRDAGRAPGTGTPTPSYRASTGRPAIARPVPRDRAHSPEPAAR